MLLSLFHDRPSSEAHFTGFENERVLKGLGALGSRVERQGLASLDPETDVLADVCAEKDAQKRVVRCFYGFHSLSCEARQHPEWNGLVAGEIQQIGKLIRKVHRVPLRYQLWVGTGNSTEDKCALKAAGLLRRGAKCYVLDSAEPWKLNHILADIVRRSSLSIPEVLRSTLVIGIALEPTSPGLILNLNRLQSLYGKCRVDAKANFVCLARQGSELEAFSTQRGYQRIDPQLDGRDTTAANHGAPLTRGSLYALALAHADLTRWIEAASLTDRQVQSAWRLAAFVQAQVEAGRDKLTLLLPKPWAGAGVWTKRNFEHIRGDGHGSQLKVIVDEKLRLANYRPPKDPLQDRVFLAMQIKGVPEPGWQKVSLLRRAGYPVAALTFPRDAVLSSYMQFIHYAVFGFAYLRKMHLERSPDQDLSRAAGGGGVEHTYAGSEMRRSPRSLQWRGAIKFQLDGIPKGVQSDDANAPRLYAALLRLLSSRGEMDYAELAFFGDTHYSPEGRAMRRSLDRAAEKLFRSQLKVAADVHEGPAISCACQERVVGRGRCFSTLLLSEREGGLSLIGGSADHCRAEFLATRLALAKKGHLVVAVTLKDLEGSSLNALDEFFHQAANHLRASKMEATRLRAHG